MLYAKTMQKIVFLISLGSDYASSGCMWVGQSFEMVNIMEVEYCPSHFPGLNIRLMNVDGGLRVGVLLQNFNHRLIQMYNLNP